MCAILTDGVFVVEGELQPVCLVLVEWVVVQDADVHVPLFEVIGFDHCDSGRKMALHLP